MKQWLIRFVFFLVALGSSFPVFLLKYRVIDLEEELKQIHKQIQNDAQEIHVLSAEWAFLNNPERLRELLKTQTGWQMVQSNQVLSVDNLPMRSAPNPGSSPFADEEISEEHS